MNRTRTHGQHQNSTRHAVAKPERNYTLEAVTYQYNLIFLAFLMLLSVVMWSAMPLTLAAGVEMIYLAMVPGTEVFQRSVENKYRAIEADNERKKLESRVEKLPLDRRARLEQVMNLIENTRANLTDDPDNMLSGVESRLGAFQERYLGLCEAEHNYRTLMNTVNEGALVREIAGVEQEIKSASSRVKRSLEERYEVLVKRLERMRLVRDNGSIIRNQLATIEDTLKLIHESSLTMRNPQSVSTQLDDLLSEMQIAEDAVLEAESVVGSNDSRLEAFERELEEATSERS